MAKKPVAATLADVINSPEYKGMSDSVKQQIENALLESKGKPPLPKTSKKAISAEEVLANPAMVKAIKEKIGEEAAEDFIKKTDEKSKIDDTDKPIVVDKQNKVRKTKQKTRKQQEIEQQENTQRSLNDIILGKGSRAFNKMFPMLGALMGGVYRGGDRSSNNNTTAQTNTTSNASGTTAILSSIIDSQKTSVDILQQILTAIKATPRTPPPTTGRNQTPPPPASNQNQTPPASNQNQRSSTTPPVTGPRAQMNLGTAAATVAGGAAIAGAGYAAQQAISGAGRNATAEPIREESGTYNHRATGLTTISVDYSNSGGKYVIDNREVDRETYSNFKQLIRRAELDPRYLQYLQEARRVATRDDFLPPETVATDRLTDVRAREVRELLQRVQRLPMTAITPPTTPTTPTPPTTPAAPGTPATTATPTIPSTPTTRMTMPVSSSPAAPGTTHDITTGMPIGAPAPPPTAESASLWSRFMQFVQRKDITFYTRVGYKIATMIGLATIPGFGWFGEVVAIVNSVSDARTLYGYWREFNSMSEQEQNTAGQTQVATPVRPNTTPIAPVTPATPTQPSGGIRMGREISESSRITPTPAGTSSTNPAESLAENYATTQQRLGQTRDKISKAGTEAAVEAEQRGVPASITQRLANAQYKSAEDETNDATPLKSASQEAEEEDLRENRILNFKADEIYFKADKFEFMGANQDANATTGTGGGGTSGNAPPDPKTTSTGGSAGGGGGGGNAPAGSGSTGGGNNAAPAAPAPNATSGGGGENGGEGVNGAVSGGGDASQAANPTPVTGLNFAPGVDQRIKPGIADKVKDVQSGFGKGLSITSGYRDPARNARVGGATGSKHLTGDAVDVKFAGNQEDTINFIKAASAKGLGGIGVYGPGFVHIDTGSKRVWGPDYSAGSIPAWARAALNDHMTGQTTATPAGSSPTSGAAVAQASAQNEMSTRSAPAPAVSQSTSNPSNAAAQPISPSNPIDPNNPGPLEPPDAGTRYARLFSMVA